MVRKHTRRQFLKQGVKTGAVAGVYATIGGTLGKVYEHISNAYRVGVKEVGTKLEELDERVENSEEAIVKYVAKPAKKVESFRSKLYRDLFGRSEEDQEKWREAKGIGNSKEEKPKASPKPEERTTRREFFGNLLHYASEHPVATGIGVGAGYGTAKTAPGAIAGYSVARLRDEVSNLKETVGKLEKKKEDLEGRLEDKTPKLILVGIAGIIITILLSAVNLTGFSISTLNKTDLPIISPVIFLLSFTLIIIGYKKKNFK